MKNQPTVTATISIPTLWTKPQLLEQCLQSLEKLIVPRDVSLQVVVVSNTTEELMKAHLAHCKISPSLDVLWLAQGSNTGFAAATNAGFKAISADYYLCLNDDTQVDSNWLVEILKAQAETGADMVASRIFLADGQTLDSEGFTFAWRGKAEALKNGKSALLEFPDYWLKNHVFFSKTNGRNFWQEPFGPDAAACLYTRKLMETVGMFDASFYAYLEDVELALRARKAGMRCVLAQEAIVRHHKHATSSTMSNFKAKQDMLNWWRLVSKYPLAASLYFFPIILLERVRNFSGYLKSLR